MNQYRTRFHVIGSSHFPLDMLRYDSCFPDSTEAADEIECSVLARAQHQDITLQKLHVRKDPQLTPERWSSFLWIIDRSSITTERIS